MANYQGTYNFNGETYTVDSSGTIRNASGAVIGSVDPEGTVLGTTGQALGRVTTSGGSASFTDTSGRTATGTVSAPTAPSQPQLPAQTYGGGIPSGAYQFGDQIFVVTPTGNVLDKSGAQIGYIDNGGRVTDLSGNYLGKFNPGRGLPGGQVTFTDAAGGTAKGARTSYTAGGITFHAQSPDIDVSGRGSIATDVRHPYTGNYSFSGGQEYQVWHDGTIWKLAAGKAGGGSYVPTGLYVDPSGTIRSTDAPNTVLGTLSVSNGATTININAPGNRASLTGRTNANPASFTGPPPIYRGSQIYQAGQTGRPAPAAPTAPGAPITGPAPQGPQTPGAPITGPAPQGPQTPQAPQPPPTTPGAQQGLLSGATSEELNRTLSFLEGLLTKTTGEFLSAQDQINQFSQALSQAYAKGANIADVLETLGFNTFETLHPMRETLQNLVGQAISKAQSAASGIEGITPQARETIGQTQELLSDILARLGRSTRLLGRYQKPIFGTSTEASRQIGDLASRIAELSGLPDREIANLRDVEQLLGGILQRGIAERQEPLAREATQRLMDILAGNITLPAFIQQDLARREQELKETLLRNLGTGYETSTPGTQAIMDFERLRQGVMDEFRQQELARLTQLLGFSESNLAQSVASRANLADVLLRDIVGAGGFKTGALSESAENRLRALEALVRGSQAQASITQMMGEAGRSGAGALGGLMDQYLRLAGLMGMPQELISRGAGLQSGLIQDIGNIAKLGFSLGESLLGQRSKLAMLPLAGAQARQELAMNAINALGKAALLPAQARSTYMGLLFSALEPTIPTVNPSALLGALATISQPSPQIPGLAAVLSNFMPSSTPLASALANFGQTLGGGIMKALGGTSSGTRAGTSYEG